jgi:hypothetical protein
MTSLSCTVCLTDCNKSTRCPSECPHCKTVICRQCLQNYVLHTIQPIIICTNTECKREWDREFLDSQLTKVFRNTTFKEYREQVLFDRERARLPEAQTHAVEYKKAKDALTASQAEYDAIVKRRKELREELERAEESYNLLYSRRYRAQRTLDSYGTRPYEDRIVGSETVKPGVEPKRVFIRPCPAEGCRGFLNTAYVCGLCEKHTCAKCLELKTSDEHSCDPEKVASTALINSETKPCPKCGVRIVRISGCPQMWCTSCNTGFNWNTGEIARGPVHNPHYMEWAARTGRTTLGGNTCEQNMDASVWRTFYVNESDLYRLRSREKSKTVHMSLNEYIREAWRLVREFQDRTTKWNRGNTDSDFHDLRVRYLAGDFNDEEWKVALQRQEKNALFTLRRQQINDVFVMGMNDIMQEALKDSKKIGKSRLINETYRRIRELIEYVNDCFTKNAGRFGRKPLLVEVMPHNPYHHRGQAYEEVVVIGAEPPENTVVPVAEPHPIPANDVETLT